MGVAPLRVNFGALSLHDTNAAALGCFTSRYLFFAALCYSGGAALRHPYKKSRGTPGVLRPFLSQKDTIKPLSVVVPSRGTRKANSIAHRIKFPYFRILETQRNCRRTTALNSTLLFFICPPPPPPGGGVGFLTTGRKPGNRALNRRVL